MDLGVAGRTQAIAINPSRSCHRYLGKGYHLHLETYPQKVRLALFSRRSTGGFFR